MIEQVDTVALIGFINRKKKLHQKLLLDGIEQLLGTDHPKYLEIRKLILDNTSDFSRAVVRTIFGDDYEGYIK